MSDEKRPAPVEAGAPTRTLAPGTRVRITAGAFSGKSGVVREPDGKGGVMVELGQLLVRVAESELEIAPAARARPVLSTSHVGRRPGKKAR